MNLPPQKLVSLTEHNKIRNVDRLYDPLRHGLDPSSQHYITNNAINRSHVSRHILPLSQQERQALRKSTLIPKDDALIPTHNLALLAGSSPLAVIQSQQRVGQPISADQVREKIMAKPQDEIIVYQLGEKPKPIEKTIVIEKPLNVNEYKMGSLDINNRISKPYRYNLFSVIDEPFNHMMESPGCNFSSIFTQCAPNEIVASRQQPRSNWLR